MGYAAVDPVVRRVVGEAVRVFERVLGCVIEEAHPGWEDPFGAFWGVAAAESDLKGLREIAAKHGAKMKPHVVDFINHPWTAENLTTANVARKVVADRMWRFMRRYDALLTPTLAVPPFGLHIQGVEKIDGRIVQPFQWLAFTVPRNLTGNPAASVPAGFTPDGLPMGLQIIGRHLDDATVLRRGGVRGGAALGGPVAGGRAGRGLTKRAATAADAGAYLIADEPYYRPVGDEPAEFEPPTAKGCRLWWQVIKGTTPRFWYK